LQRRLKKSTGVEVRNALGDTHPTGAEFTGATVKGDGDNHPAAKDYSGAAFIGAHGNTHPAVADARETGSSLRGTGGSNPARSTDESSSERQAPRITSESPRTTKLYDRTKERLTQDEVERIRL